MFQSELVVRRRLGLPRHFSQFDARGILPLSFDSLQGFESVVSHTDLPDLIEHLTGIQNNYEILLYSLNIFT